MRIENYTKSIKVILFALVTGCLSFNSFSQTIYTNDMDYVLGDTKQAFITNQITTIEKADNLLKGFAKLKVNGIRIPLFGRGVDGVDLNPNKSMMDYFYNQALAQGFDIFANPAQGGGGHRVANNRLNGNGSNEGAESSVNGVQAATDELVNRVIQFSNQYPGCKWINPFNEDGRATNSTWSISQINEIYQRLYNHGVNGAELIGPCTWGLPAGIDMLQNTAIADYITVAATHNLGFNHNQWSSFIALAKAEGFPVWDSEVNHNDAKDNGTRLEKAIENKVDGLVLYNSWNTISLTDGSINPAAQNQMLLYLKDYTIPVNIAVNGTASQSSTNHDWNMEASRAIDGNTAGSFASGNGSISLTNVEENPWWQVDLGANKRIDDIKIFNRTDSCCKNRMSDFTVYVIDASGTTTFSKTYTIAPDPSVVVNAGNVQGQIIRIQLNSNNALALAEVQVYEAEAGLSVNDKETIPVSVYPNPVSDIFKVAAPIATFNQFEIYNISGQQILSGNISNSARVFEVNLSAFSKGIYVLKLQGDQVSRTLKVIKK
ncbi:discoidin domain-containing protein [Mariniflexile sp. AS56]|uniref:galactose-binding domain-containing protein n=1 Tax=Mariniflexile sp. AS56 TaxID=3063957 RepID=UPI0026F23595|nr:discoidin domain-containing protein [Mariniflexile sp. AS56]MDO7172361.1 discoidin domain-containing protein [Mariniflexile sp. AS56]